MVDEVHAQVKEMLEVGAICPSQSPWCNVAVLVHKKDGGLHFCIEFHKLNARTIKDSYPLRKLGWSRMFLLPGSESSFLANCHG